MNQPTLSGYLHSEFMTETEQIKTLCSRVEETAGMKAVKSKDFEHLVIKIYERTGTLISPTTLKRLWGYLKEPTVTRQSTLDVLSQFCGWHSYLNFCSCCTPEVESGFLSVKVLNADRDLKKGDVVKLMWNPARLCEAEYLGNSNWRILKSEGTRLLPGDTFRCLVIMSGEPLYLDNVVHGGKPVGVYVCGRRNGIRFAIAPKLTSLRHSTPTSESTSNSDSE